MAATSVRENSCSAVRPIEGSEKGRNMGETGWLLLRRRLHGVKKKRRRQQERRQRVNRSPKKVTTALPHFGSQEVGGGGVCVYGDEFEAPCPRRRRNGRPRFRRFSHPPRGRSVGGGGSEACGRRAVAHALHCWNREVGTPRGGNPRMVQKAHARTRKAGRQVFLRTRKWKRTHTKKGRRARPNSAIYVSRVLAKAAPCGR